MRMNEFESLDDMLNYVSDNADTILKNVDYDLDDPEGMKRALELKAMQELLDEMVAEGLIKIVGKNENGDDLYQASVE